MTKLKTLVMSAPIALAICLPAPGAFARDRDKELAIGLGLGLLGAAIISRGDPDAMVGGAVLGGTAGYVSGRYRDRDKYREWREIRRGEWREHRRHRGEDRVRN